MSNRRRLTPVHPIAAGLRRQDGARWPGGCDDCDAYTEVEAPVGHPNIAMLTVRHDDTCPRYLELLARGEAGYQPPSDQP